MIEPFAYAAMLHARSFLHGREPTREEISMLLFAFAAWAGVFDRKPEKPKAP